MHVSRGATLYSNGGRSVGVGSNVAVGDGVGVIV